MLVSATFGSATPAVTSPYAVASATPAIADQSAQSVQQFARKYFADIPIMIDIARCESKFRQFDADGNVLRGKVNTGDIGLMQINEGYHAEAAAKLGVDINTIEGNAAYARHLYDREGTQPWISSSKCWGKNKNDATPAFAATISANTTISAQPLAMSR